MRKLIEDMNEAAESREMAYFEKQLKEMKGLIEAALKEVKKDGTKVGPSGKKFLKMLKGIEHAYWYRALTGGAMPPGRK